MAIKLYWSSPPMTQCRHTVYLLNAPHDYWKNKTTVGTYKVLMNNTSAFLFIYWHALHIWHVLLEDIYNLLEDLLLLLYLQPGVALVALAAPSPPPLHVVRWHEVGESRQGARDSCPEAVSRNWVTLKIADIRQQGPEGRVEACWGEEFSWWIDEDRVLWLAPATLLLAGELLPESRHRTTPWRWEGEKIDEFSLRCSWLREADVYEETITVWSELNTFPGESRRGVEPVFCLDQDLAHASGSEESQHSGCPHRLLCNFWPSRLSQPVS